MRFGRLRAHYEENNKPKASRSSKVFPPWEDTHFKITPSASELAEMRDGQRWKKTAIVRFVDPDHDNTGKGPYKYEECYLGGKNHIATSEAEGFDGKDVIKHYYNMTPKEDEQARRNLWHSKKWAIQLIDFRWFDTEVIEVGGRERMVYHECAPPKSQEEAESLVFGGQKVWSMSKTRFEMLMHIDEELFNIATNDNEAVFGKPVGPTVGFYCMGCEHELISERDIETMRHEDLNSAFWGTHVCPECGHEGRAKELALVEDDEGNAIAAERGSVYDKNIKIVCTGEKCTIGGKAKSKNYNLQLIHEGQNFSHIYADLGDLGFSEKEVDDFLEPMDFKWIFRPEMLNPEKFDSHEEYVQEVLDRQAQAIGKENPYKNDVAKPSRSRPFENRSSGWRRQ